jgi:hypothetical protein
MGANIFSVSMLLDALEGTSAARRQRRLQDKLEAETRRNATRFPNTRRSGTRRPPPGRTISGRNVPRSRAASSSRRGGRLWRPIWWWSITTFSLPT